jgi:hypothetical protein
MKTQLNDVKNPDGKTTSQHLPNMWFYTDSIGVFMTHVMVVSTENLTKI